MIGTKTRIVLLFAFASAHLLFFQNCSKIAFSNTDTVAEKANQANGFEGNDAADNSDDSEHLADNNDTDIDGVAGDNSPDMNDGNFPDGELDTDYHSSGDVPLTADEVAENARDEAACAAFRAESPASFDFTFNSPIVKIHRVRGSVLVLGAEILKAKNIRGSLYVRAPLTGAAVLASAKDSPSKIKNVRGALCVVSTASGKIRKINNHRGYAELASLSGVRQLRNMRGKLVIRNSTVDRIINHRGPIVLINSRVDRIRNQRGSITLLGSSSVGKAKNIRP